MRFRDSFCLASVFGTVAGLPKSVVTVGRLSSCWLQN